MVVRRRIFERIWTRVQINRESLRIHARFAAAQGNRLPLVFVPGLGLSGRTLCPTSELLPHDHPVFLVDLPGCGDSERPAKRANVRMHAWVLAAWLNEIGWQRAAWIGHSFGCQVAAELAVRHPEAVERLVLVSPTVDRRARSMIVQLARLLCDAAREPLPLLPVLAREYVKTGAGALLDTGRSALHTTRSRPSFPL